MTLAAFDVVVVPFPYSDNLAEKRRPAVVVSAPELETAHGLVWVAMITSAPGPDRLGDTAVSDLEAAGLNRACRIRGAKIASLDAGRVLRRAGTLAPPDRLALARALGACSGWSSA